MTRRAALWAGLFLAGVWVIAPGPTSSPQTSAAAGPGDPFGVLFSVGATADPASIDRMFAGARDLGVSWVRTDFFWDIIEPERGVFRWAVPDGIVRAAGAHSIKVLGILDYCAPWASSDPAGQSDKYPPRQLSDFARYVAMTVSRYRGAVSHWEVWNEPDIREFWRGSAEEFATLLAVSYRVVKAVNPESRVVLGGLGQGGNHDPAFLDKVLTFCRERAEPCFDIMAFHTNFRTMRDIRQQFDSNRRILARYGFDRPIWITESSYTSDPRFQTLPGYEGGEVPQARYLMDATSLSLSLGAERVFWAGLYDYDPPAAVASGLDAYAASGLLRADGRPKAAHLAYQGLARRTAGPARPGLAGDGPGHR